MLLKQITFGLIRTNHFIHTNVALHV